MGGLPLFDGSAGGSAACSGTTASRCTMSSVTCPLRCGSPVVTRVGRIRAFDPPEQRVLHSILLVSGQGTRPSGPQNGYEPRSPPVHVSPHTGYSLPAPLWRRTQLSPGNYPHLWRTVWITPPARRVSRRCPADHARRGPAAARDSRTARPGRARRVG